jgi:hypothetical protein
LARFTGGIGASRAGLAVSADWRCLVYAHVLAAGTLLPERARSIPPPRCILHQGEVAHPHTLTCDLRYSVILENSVAPAGLLCNRTDTLGSARQPPAFHGSAYHATTFHPRCRSQRGKCLVTGTPSSDTSIPFPTMAARACLCEYNNRLPI